MRVVQKVIAGALLLVTLTLVVLIVLGNAVDRDRDVAVRSSTSLGAEPTPAVVTLDPGVTLTRGLVERVSDGDTVRVRIGDTVETVRLVGIDAPETATTLASDCLADDARDYLTRLVNGKTVYLEQDVNDRDQYGRLLRYLWLPQGDGHLLVSQMIVGQGLAVARIYGQDDKHAADLAGAELNAIQQQRGIWGTCVSENHRGVPGAPPHWDGRSDLDCGDFSTRVNAQAFFADQGGPGRDPHYLDIDRDGRVCYSRRPTEPLE